MFNAIFHLTLFIAILALAIMLFMGIWCWYAHRFRRAANWLDGMIDTFIDGIFKRVSEHVGVSPVEISQSELPMIITIKSGENELWSGHFREGLVIEISRADAVD